MGSDLPVRRTLTMFALGGKLLSDGLWFRGDRLTSRLFEWSLASNNTANSLLIALLPSLYGVWPLLTTHYGPPPQLSFKSDRAPALWLQTSNICVNRWRNYSKELGLSPAPGRDIAFEPTMGSLADFGKCHIPETRRARIGVGWWGLPTAYME